MSVNRKKPVAGSAALLTVSLALCLGAATEAAAVTSTLRAANDGERIVLSARHRHALATLFAQLTDTARKFQQAPQVLAISPSADLPSVDPESPTPAVYRPLDRDRSLPTPPLREALLNLPPPAMG